VNWTLKFKTCRRGNLRLNSCRMADAKEAERLTGIYLIGGIKSNRTKKSLWHHLIKCSRLLKKFTSAGGQEVWNDWARAHVTLGFACSHATSLISVNANSHTHLLEFIIRYFSWRNLKAHHFVKSRDGAHQIQDSDAYVKICLTNGNPYPAY